MFLVGHFGTQRPQLVHFSKLIKARLFSIVMAPYGHAFTQAPQPMHPAEQYFLTTAPRSTDMQLTTNFVSAGTTRMVYFGHAFSHFPQPVHFSSSTTGRPFSMWMASNGQTTAHVPRPTQPY